MNLRRRLSLLIALVMCAVAAPFARAADQKEPPKVPPKETKDPKEKDKPLDLKSALPVDGSVKMGKLPNGMTYWIRKHDRPPEKISIWLHVGSGSINEDDSQRGLAHFLEHLAFNGTEHFPPGEVVKYFESIGLRFGQHQNAFTSFDQTTYQISLPDTKVETIEKGMQFMSDVAFRMSLLPAEVEKERNVVLEEARARKGAHQRILEKLLPILTPASRFADRLPIGKEEIIEHAEVELFKSYYASWYRPDNSTVMIVGDCDPAVVEKIVKEQFKDWKTVEKPKANADPGIKPYDELRAAVITDPELTETEVSAVCVGPLTKDLTVGDLRARLVESLGSWIVNRRLDELIQKGEAPFQSAGVGVSPFLNVCTYVNAEASGKPDQWKPMLERLLTELKRARVHGFLDQELDDAKKETLEGAIQSAKTEATWDARAFLGRMNGAISQGTKPMSETQRLDLIQKLLPGITLQEVTEAFRGFYAQEKVLLLVTMPEKLDLSIPKKDDLLALAKQVGEAEVKALAAKQRPKTLLDQEPAPGKVVEQSEDPDLKILSVTFENGVRVHLRQMDFKKDQVYAGITIGGGSIQETPTNQGISELATLALRQPATLKYDSTTVRDLMTGKQVGVGGAYGQDAFTLSVGGAPKDLEDGFRLAYLLLTQPRVEEAGVTKWKEVKAQSLEELKTSVTGQLFLKVNEMLSGGDTRFKELTKERIEQMTTADGQAWLDLVLANGPIEAAIVGDFDRAKMLDLAARYLGSLPARGRTSAAIDAARKLSVKPGAQEAKLEIDTITPKAAVFVGWRGADWKDVKDRRILEIVSRILSTRVMKEIREERRLAYSPAVYAPPGRAYEGAGMLAVFFEADPGKADEAAKLSRELVETFAKEGPTDAEMDTVRKQLKNALETTLKEPSYWKAQLMELDFRGTKLGDVKEVIERMTGYTKEEVKEIAAKYITEERRLQVVATPRTRTPAPAPEQKSAAPAPEPEKTAAPAPEAKTEEKTPAAK